MSDEKPSADVLDFEERAARIRVLRQARQDELTALDQAAAEQRRMIDGLSQRSVEAMEKLSELPSDVSDE